MLHGRFCTNGNDPKIENRRLKITQKKARENSNLKIWVVIQYHLIDFLTSDVQIIFAAESHDRIISASNQQDLFHAIVDKHYIPLFIDFQPFRFL